jgi:hypothetical protein
MPALSGRRSRGEPVALLWAAPRAKLGLETNYCREGPKPDYFLLRAELGAYWSRRRSTVALRKSGVLSWTKGSQECGGGQRKLSNSMPMDQFIGWTKALLGSVVLESPGPCRVAYASEDAGGGDPWTSSVSLR